MTMQKFIQANRATLDDAILGAMYQYDGRGGRGVIPTPRPKLNDRERKDWILNDEGLYRWARAEGVRI